MYDLEDHSNICFGHRFDREWYDRVIRACALTEDLAILPGGDQAEVGEKGLTLVSCHIS